MDDLAQPSCPHCGTVMVDHPKGYRCGGCGHVDDHTADLDAVIIPPEFDGPTLNGG